MATQRRGRLAKPGATGLKGTRAEPWGSTILQFREVVGGRLKTIPYSSLRELLEDRLLRDEDAETANLIARLSHIREDGSVTRREFLEMCHWKSPRPLRHYERNSEEEITKTFRAVLATRSERRRLELLTELRGVSVPTASAILTLIDPQRYGVIDIRVWQLLHALGSVRTRPSGQNFDFKNWFHYLSKRRYFASELRVSVRCVERTLFEYHRQVLTEPLYARASAGR